MRAITGDIASEAIAAFFQRWNCVLRGARWLDIGLCPHTSRVTIHISGPSRTPEHLPTEFEGIAVAWSHEQVRPVGLHHVYSFGRDKARMLFGKPPLLAWPGLPGAKIGLASSTHEGTLGCYAFSPKLQTMYAITCQHIFSSRDIERSQRAVDTWTYGPRASLGRLELPPAERTLDFALVKLTDNSQGNWVPLRGRMRSVARSFSDVDVARRPTVLMYGAESGLSFGEATRFKREVSAGGLAGPLYMVIDPTHNTDTHSLTFCKPGDSGTVVCLVEGRISCRSVCCADARAAAIFSAGA